MRKLGLREVKLLVQGHTAKSVAEPESKSLSLQTLLHSVISKACVSIHKKKIPPAQGAVVRVERVQMVSNDTK